jgi:putative endonuclease
MAEHNNLGKKGEDIAADFLLLKNYEILEKNWRFGKSEVDLIAMFNGVLIFIEVKTRSTDAFGKPEEFVSQKKQDMITFAAPRYMEKIKHDWAIRFDIISIIANKDDTYSIEHIEDAFF